MMRVRNEAGRYLSTCLESLERVADRIVVLDDASTDGTPDVCRAHARVTYHRREQRLFDRDESALRRSLWDLTLAEQPDWILALDADERFEPGAEALIRDLCRQDDYDVVSFRIFDLWGSEGRVRVDGAWNPWNRFSPLLVRRVPGLSPEWPAARIHCGRFPAAYVSRTYFSSHLRVLHYGWANAAEHDAKHSFYAARDLATAGEVRPHTQSIQDAGAVTEPWVATTQPAFMALGTAHAER